MTERWAPSSAIRARAREVHPKSPAPTIDDVLWWLDLAAAGQNGFNESVRGAFKKLASEMRGGSRRRAKT